MLRSRLILLIAIVAISSSLSQAQINQQQQISCTTSYSNVRKMEVIGYATINLVPNIVYVSFTTKEYIENGKTITLEEQEKKLKQAVKDIGYNESDLKVMNLIGYSTFSMNGDESSYQKSRSYLLKLRGINCIDKYLSENKRQ